MADVRDASNSERPCRTSSRNEKALATANNGFAGPSVVRLASGGRCAGRRQVAGRVECRRRSPMRASTCSAATVPTVPVLVLLAADLRADRLEALHGTESRRGGWQLIATYDEFKLRASACAVKWTDSTLGLFRLMGSVDVPHTGVVFAANLQYFSGKPWAATTQVMVPQSDNQRIQLEPRGSRRLSSQSLLDLRVSRMTSFRGVGRVELLVDLLKCGGGAGDGQSVQSEFRPGGRLRGSPPRDGQLQGEPGPIPRRFISADRSGRCPNCPATGRTRWLSRQVSCRTSQWRPDC